MTQSEICQAIMSEWSSLFTCKEHGEYHRIRTPYLYPDGDNIDLFCKMEGDKVTVTDLGVTLGWLNMQSFSLQRTPNQKRLILVACKTHGVEYDRGMLLARCNADESVAHTFVRVAQAALRVSDVQFTFRRHRASIKNQVAEYLSRLNVRYDRSQKLRGRSNRMWPVDFRVHARERQSLVYTLSIRNRAAAPRVVDHIVAAWHDLRGEQTGQFVSLIDDSQEDVWDTNDVRRIADLSTVAFWSEPDRFAQVLSVTA